jgi:hypothetical protein
VSEAREYIVLSAVHEVLLKPVPTPTPTMNVVPCHSRHSNTRARQLRGLKLNNATDHKVFICPSVLKRVISFRSPEYEVVYSRALAYTTMWVRAAVCMPSLSFRTALKGSSSAVGMLLYPKGCFSQDAVAVTLRHVRNCACTSRTIQGAVRYHVLLVIFLFYKDSVTTFVGHRSGWMSDHKTICG